MAADYITRGISKYHGPIRISHKGLWLLEAWPAEQSPSPGLWQSSLGVNFPQSRTQTQHKHFGLKATFVQAVMSRNIPKTQAAFSQPGPVCCPMNPGEPPRAHRTLGHRAHPSVTQTVLHGQVITKLYYPTSQHQATLHLLLCMTSPSSQLPLEFQLSVDHIWMVTAAERGLWSTTAQLTMNPEECV